MDEGTAEDIGPIRTPTSKTHELAKERSVKKCDQVAYGPGVGDAIPVCLRRWKCRTVREAMVAIREQSRLVGRPLTRRSVGEHFAPQGARGQHLRCPQRRRLNARNLYVAMTRGSRSVLVCSPSPFLNPAW